MESPASPTPSAGLRLRLRFAPLRITVLFMRWVLVFVGIDHAAAGHGYTERAQLVQNTDGSGMGRQDFWQTPIGLRRFIDIAAAQLDSALGHPFNHFVIPNESITPDSF